MTPSLRRVGALDRRQFLVLSASFTIGAAVRPSAADAGVVEARDDLRKVFAEHGATGTFVLLDATAHRTIAVDAERAAKRYIPASTFKIANSIIALETGVVRDENEVIPYGGKPQPFKAWEKDMAMREAMPASAVPIYQEIARRVGLQRYRVWLDKLAYGNRQTGAALETFWLDGPLEITALEQVRFVAALAERRLPASERSLSIVRDILRLEASDGRVLYGKTGWCFSSKPQIGWWTGWVERGDQRFVFALNMDMASAAEAPKRIAIGKRLLAELGAM